MILVFEYLATGAASVLASSILPSCVGSQTYVQIRSDLLRAPSWQCFDSSMGDDMLKGDMKLDGTGTLNHRITIDLSKAAQSQVAHNLPLIDGRLA